MKKFLTGAAIGAGILTFAYCELSHFLLLSDFRGKFELPKNEPNFDRLKEIHKNELDTCLDGEWFDAMFPQDTTILNRKGEAIHAYFIKQEKPSHKWAILAHGYTSRPHQMAAQSRRYYDHGFNIVTPSARGHDKSEHKAITMGWLDRLDVLDWIHHIVKADPQVQIALHGISMGAACMMNVTGEAEVPDNVKCLVEDCGFTSCWEQFTDVIAQNIHFKAPWALWAPAKWYKLRAGWDIKENNPIHQVAKSKVPTLFLHGSEDTFVPFRMRDELYEAASCPKEKVTIQGAEHANSVDVDPETYHAACKAFVEKYIP
ncbi:MAG: alpha/beta hydrolase [Clostridia bacterium]|nr:alpha/beta hydrolase [Clostridia bacterium]